MRNRYDIAVIGSGPAGEKAALEAAELGAKVVVIEKGAQPGGASVISGTIPSKSIRETVQYVDILTHDDTSGIHSKLDHDISIKELMHRKNKVVEQRVDDIFQRYQTEGVDYFHGIASFKSENELEIYLCKTKQTVPLLADKIIIAVGTKPYNPPDVPFDEKYILDSDSILGLEKVPREITVYGGGVIGSEYACMFAKLGTKVTMIDPRERILDFVDREISAALTKKMIESGVDFKMNQLYKKIQVVDDEVVIDLKSGDQWRTSRLLYANGRQGMADKLGLAELGLEVNRRSQLDVDQHYRTKIPHIYAVGDVIGFPSLVSVSNEEGRLAARHAVLNEEVYRISDDIPYGIYTIPEIAMIGPTEDQLKENGIRYVVGTCLFSDLARSLIIGKKSGLMKLLFEEDSKKLLAAHIFGQSAAELVHVAQAVIHYQGTVDYFDRKVINFPTLSSAYKIASRDALNKWRSIRSKS